MKKIYSLTLKINPFKSPIPPSAPSLHYHSFFKKRISTCGITLVTSIASKPGCTILKNKKSILPRPTFLVAAFATKD